MPTLVQVGIWNVGCSVGTGHPMQTLMNFTGTLAHNDRYNLLQDVVTTTLTLLPPIPPTATSSIRLFLAPEYLFAKNEEKHAANYDVKTQVLANLVSLSAQHPTLVLFPGTVAYCKPLVTATKDRRMKYARVMPTNPHMQQPLRVSHNTAYVFHNGGQVFKYRKATDASELDPQEQDGGRMVYVPGTGPSVFNLLGQTIGIEICADHESGWLLRNRPQSDLDIHIILSASATFTANYACVREGGIVCHADSSNPPAVYQKVHGVMVPQPTIGGVVGLDPSLDPRLAATADTLRKDHTRAVVDKLKGLPMQTATDPRFRANQIARKQEEYLNARGGKLGVFQITI